MVFLDRRTRKILGEMVDYYWSTYEEEKANLDLVNTYNIGGSLCDTYLEEKTFCVKCLVFKLERLGLGRFMDEIKEFMHEDKSACDFCE